MLPIVTLIALNLGFTVAGAIYIETVFSYDGLGNYFRPHWSSRITPSCKVHSSFWLSVSSLPI
jgi:ABC-type dipeptide/oligopeptide/nickel transport system permease component